MTWTPAELEALREGWDFEAKKAAGRDGDGKVPADFWPTYSAMANARGGKVLLGVKERADGSFELHGLGDPGKVERELWDLLQNPKKVSTNLLREGDVEVEEIEGHRILVVSIPRAPREHRPVFINDDPWGGCYIRVHEGDRALPRDRVRRMIADADRSHPRDGRVLRNYGIDDLHEPTIQAYRRVLASRNADHPFLREDPREFLRRLGAWGTDREEGVEGLRLAGLLLFGNEAAIRDELPHFFLDYRHRTVETERSGGRWADRVFPDGTWNANVLQFYWRVYPKLVEGLRLPFSLGPDMVRRGETPVHEALREALINCLIHADYNGTQGPRVIRHVSGFEFRNEGLLLVPVDQARRGGDSECRNPTLQHAFTLLGLGERAGSGVPKILQAWREQHWRAPSIEEDPGAGTTTLALSQASLLPEEVIDDLRRRFPDFSTLEPDGVLTLATAGLEERVTNRRLQELTDKHPRDLTFLLKGLVDRQMLVAHGERGGTWYTIPEEPRDQRQLPLLSGERSPQGAVDSPQSSPQSVVDSPQSAVDSPQSSPQTDPVVRRVAESRWAPATQVREAVLHLCRGRYLTTREIAEQLSRKASTVQQNYLVQMVREGLLRHLKPEQPNAPDQAYTTAESTETP